MGSKRKRSGQPCLGSGVGARCVGADRVPRNGVRAGAGGNDLAGRAFIGDGATGAMAYAPAHLEWTINRNDVLDSRVFSCEYTPHAEVMACVATNAGHSVAFLRAEKQRTKGFPDGGSMLTASLSAAILHVRF